MKKSMVGYMYICQCLFKMRFQKDLTMTADEYFALKSVASLLPACGKLYDLRLRYYHRPEGVC